MPPFYFVFAAAARMSPFDAAIAAIDEGVEDFERSDHVDGFELIAQMRARREAPRR